MRKEERCREGASQRPGEDLIPQSVSLSVSLDGPHTWRMKSLPSIHSEGTMVPTSAAFFIP